MMLHRSETSCPFQPAPYLYVSLFLCCLTVNNFSEHLSAHFSPCSGATPHPQQPLGHYMQFISSSLECTQLLTQRPIPFQSEH